MRPFDLAWSVVVFAGLAIGATGAAAAGEPFDYFRNSWNVIGLKDYSFGTRITPENELLLGAGVRARIGFGPNAMPLSRKQIKTLLDGWLPVVLLTAEDGAVRYEFTLWATPLPTAKDWQRAFDWPTEGENYLNWIWVKITNSGPGPAQAALALNAERKPQPVSRQERWTLAPGQSVRCVVTIPYMSVADEKLFRSENPQVWLDRCARYWRDLVLGAGQIEVPCRKSNEALLAAHVCQLIANDHGVLHGGEGFYDEFYIRDGAYQLLELEEAGFDDAAAKAVESFLGHQRHDGRFESQKNQFDANGQALWTLWQYAKITGNRAWLEKIYPQMRRAADWAMKARRGTPADSAFAGVLPAAPADGEYLWDGKHHIVGYDIWNLRGLLCTADAAHRLGKTDEAELLTREAEAYRAAIDAVWKRAGLAYFPPSWEKDGTHWGNTELLWPTEMFAPDDPRVTATIDEVRHRHGGGFVEGTIRWTGAKDAIHPYLSAYTTMGSLARGEHDQVVEDYYWYLLHSTAAHAFPEGIFFRRRFAWSNTIPHVTGACNFAIMLRHMLVHERGEELHLLAGTPHDWLANGRQIRMERLPTHFGPLDLTVRGTAAGVEVAGKLPTRQAPRRIVLYLPEGRPLVGPRTKMEVVARAREKAPWDFARVVQLYRQQPGSAPPSIPGIFTPTALSDQPERRFHPLDLATLANTNPFTAPFGVEKPGKFLFTGMPVGATKVLGIPFELIDPAKNGGRGLIVLASPRAPKNRIWPREVEIPVNQAGRRIYFLGNVHGWSSDDPGTGTWGAVAEYVIHYRDGQQQVIPLITGRTADDWVCAPMADDVVVGLQGQPWHLNILGAMLRPAPVARIVFRDLGTPAAPLLAAVTVEE